MPRHSLSIGSVIAERYEIEELLASGGFGHVFAAHHTSLHTRVAIKVVRPDRAAESYQKRFLREARVVAALRHPNIVSVLDLGNLEDGTLFLAMEYVDGVPLHRLLGTGPMPTERVLHILEQVARALHYAHTHGVLHRDLKPANVMVVPIPGDSDHVKLIDFGILKHFSVGRNAIVDGVSEVVTSPAAVVGTPDYMAPEQILQHKLDGRADIYALGVMAYEMLVGKRPFAADNYGDLMLQQLHAPPAPIDTLRDGTVPPTALEPVLLRALAKEPSQRPATAPEFVKLLREACAPGLQKQGIRTRSVLRLAATMTLPALAAATAMYWFLRPIKSGDEDPPTKPSAAETAPIPALVTSREPVQMAAEKPAEIDVATTESSHDTLPAWTVFPDGGDSPNSAPPQEILRTGIRRDYESEAFGIGRRTELTQIEIADKKKTQLSRLGLSDTPKGVSPSKHETKKTTDESVTPLAGEPLERLYPKSTVSISVKPFGHVQLGSGQNVASPIRSAKLSKGAHRITASHPSLGKYTAIVSVDGGKTYVVLIDMYSKTHQVREQ